VNDLLDTPYASPTRPFVYNGVEIHLGGRGVVVDPASTTVTRADVRAAFASLETTEALDVSADGLHLYLLKFGGDLIRYAQDGSHTTILTGLPSVQCMAVDETGGFLYFGTADSRILRTPIPA
jgi:hypothetical protein